MSIQETGKCCLCGGVYTLYGCNPDPVCTIPDARCCHKCNYERVIPARSLNYGKPDERDNLVSVEEYLEELEASKNCCLYAKAPNPLCNGCGNTVCEYHKFM